MATKASVGLADFQFVVGYNCSPDRTEKGTPWSVYEVNFLTGGLSQKFWWEQQEETGKRGNAVVVLARRVNQRQAYHVEGCPWQRSPCNYMFPLFDCYCFLRVINLAWTVSIGTMQRSIVMNGAITVLGERNRTQRVLYYSRTVLNCSLT